MVKVTVKEDLSLECSDPSLKPGVYELKAITKKRSNGQNAYLHTILFPMAAKAMSVEFDKKVSNEFAKEVLKFKFLKNFNDIGIVINKTSNLTTKECMTFIEQCQRYVAEHLGVSIPSPNEVDYSIDMEMK